MTKYIGENIHNFRKKKGASQAEMADYLGVSAQAISKWERGGAPDILLLPKIADYLGVSIDALFSRETGSEASITDSVEHYISTLDAKNQMLKACEIAWHASRAVMNIPEYEPRTMNPKTSVTDLQYNRDSFSSNYGMLYGYINQKCPGILLMTEPEEGFNALFADKEELSAFFATLSDPQFMMVIEFLYKREALPFSLEFLSSKLKITADKAKIILDRLHGLDMVTEAKIETENGLMYVYQPTLKECFIPFMFYASEMLRRIDMWNMLYSTRTKPLLK